MLATRTIGSVKAYCLVIDVHVLDVIKSEHDTSVCLSTLSSNLFSFVLHMNRT